MYMTDEIRIRPFTADMELTGYMPVPRQLLEMELPSTAILIYGALLDRGTLSRKNRYTDDLGQIYVIFPVDRLSELFGISNTAVKSHLRILETLGLIRRSRRKRHQPIHIFLNLPEGSIQGTKPEENCPVQGRKTGSTRERKVPPNNRTEQHNLSNYYQHGEDESL